MENQTPTVVTSSTVLQSFFAVTAIVLCTALLLAKIKKNSAKVCKPVTETGRDKGELVLRNYHTAKLCKPVMETGRERGKMVLGNYDIAH